MINARIASKTSWDGVVKIIMRQEFSAGGVAKFVEFINE
jgi:hypothetical protein